MVKPSCFPNSLNSLELKGGPLSVSILLGVPYVAKICFNLSLFASKLIDGTASTAGYRVRLWIMMRL